MKNSPKAVVEKMFEAFSEGDVEKLVDTVSEDTVWVYHGTQIIPAGTFEKKEGVRTFFTNILERTEIINFEPQQYIVEDNMVVVLGKELKQKWVQIYTVENNLITKMEEFATSEEVTT